MNEAETRAEQIDPKIKACGWGVDEGSKVLREYHITESKIQSRSFSIFEYRYNHPHNPEPQFLYPDGLAEGIKYMK